MKHRNRVSISQPEEIRNQLQTLVAEAKKMISDPLGENGGDVATLRDRLAAAQEQVSEFYYGARKQVVAGAKYADKAIRDQPYHSLAVALGVGVLLGIFVGRRAR